MDEDKRTKYAPFRVQLERQNIEYMPLIFSAFGRPHPEAYRFLLRVTKQLARRRSFASAPTLLRRLEQDIATELRRRAARMVIACSP